MSSTSAKDVAADTAAQSTGPRSAIPATSAAQQSDNISHALAGAGGGLAAMALTYPLITLSTRAQVESKRASTTTIDAIRHIISREGISGLYSGLDSALFGISVTNFVYYYWYEWSRSFFERAALKAGRASTKLSTVESMAAGALAGSATVLLTNPIWVVNTRMTARQSSSTSSGADTKSATQQAADEEKGLVGSSHKTQAKQSTIATLMSIIREEGFGALFSGVTSALVLVANPILQYTIFEQLKNVLEARRKRAIGPRDSFLLGALGKLAATSITYPYITLKSRAHVAKKQGKGDGLIGGLQKIIREEGVSALYGGIGPKVSQSVLTAAFLFAFKDVLYDMSVKLRRNAAAKAKLV